MMMFFVQYPISFALNLAIPTDRVIGAKQVYCAASPTSTATAVDSAEVKVTSSKGDEADADQLKVGAAKLQSYYHPCSEGDIVFSSVRFVCLFVCLSVWLSTR